MYNSNQDLQWPTRWDPKDIEADFAKMRELGYSLVRFDLLWAWFEPRPGDYNPAAFEQLDFLVSLAHKYRIYLHPSLFIGGEVGEAYWDVPWRHGRNPHTDPDMLRLEADHAAELGRRYANETAIVAWDLTDEPPFWIVAGQTTDAAAINWTRLVTWGLRRHDRLHPIVVGTSGQETGHGPFRADDIAADVDFLSVHPFTIYEQDLFPDPLLSQRGTYGAAFEIALAAGAGKPAMIHEMGASSAQYAPERIALETLSSWSTHKDPGVKYFSGAGTYRNTFTIPASLIGPSRRLFLDLGRVEVSAEVLINGHSLGILWKEPYRVDITQAVRAGTNQLQIRVANLWPNRLIGDEQLPAENAYNSRTHAIERLPEWYLKGDAKPTGGRTTFTTWQFYSKNDPLLESGLLGPVRLFYADRRAFSRQ